MTYFRSQSRRSLHDPDKHHLKKLIQMSCLFSVLWITTLQASDSGNSIRIALSTTPLSAPFIIAQNKGFFSKAGIQVIFNQFNGGHLAAQSLFTDNADIATSSEAVVMFNSFKRDDFAIAASFVSSYNDVKIITTRQSGIQSLSDLSQKRVGIIKAASAHFFLDYTLLMNGISTRQINYISIKPEDTLSLLKNNQVDAVACWEPFVFLARQSLGDKSLIIPHGQFYNETFNVLVSKTWASQNNQQLVAVLQALKKAIEYIDTEPDQAQQLVATFLKQDMKLIQAIWNDLNFSLSLHQSLLTTLEAEARWAIKRGFVDSTKMPNYLNYLLIDPINQVSPETVTVIH